MTWPAAAVAVARRPDQASSTLRPSLRLAGSARIVNVGSGSGPHGDPTFGLAW